MKKILLASLLVLMMSDKLLTVLVPPSAFAQSNEELAKELANPLTSLTYVPIQMYYDSDIGPDDTGDRYSMNIQPLIPFSINNNWKIISRTILPLVTQDDVFSGAGGQTGFGDVVQSLFLSPEKPTEDGWIWGAGPVFLLPTGSDVLLGSEKWGLGPTVVVLRQKGPWTYGVLTNHIWSIAGDDDRPDVNASFVQPFVDYTTKSAITFEITTESTFDWESDQWTVPLVATVTKVLKWGNQYVSVGGGVRYWLETTDSDPERWGLNIQITFMFPK